VAIAAVAVIFDALWNRARGSDPAAAAERG
jgi:hypothetical protein